MVNTQQQQMDTIGTDEQQPASWQQQQKEQHLNVVSVLQTARKLIENEESWIKDDVAQDEYGDAVDSFDHRAVRFCALGAIWRAVYDLNGGVLEGDNCCNHKYSDLATVALDIVARERDDRDKCGCVALFNDMECTEHHEVLEVFDAAIGAEFSMFNKI